MNYNINLKALVDTFDIDQFLLEHKKVEKKNPFRGYDKETVIIFNRPVELHTFIKRKDTYLFITDINELGNGDNMIDGYVLTKEQHRHYILTDLLSDIEGETDNV